MKTIKLLFILLAVSVLAFAVAAGCGCGDDDDDDDDDVVDDDVIDDDIVDDDVTDDDVTDDDVVDDDVVDDDVVDDDVVDDDVVDDDVVDDDVVDDDMVDDDTTVEMVDFAYIYDTDDTLAQAYATFLEGRDYTIELHEIAELDSKIDFSNVRAFLAGDSTVDDWTSDRAAVLTGTDKPIIAFGGGIFVFEFLDQYLDGAKCSVVAQNGIYPKSLGHPVWHTPNELGISGPGVTSIIDSGTVETYELQGDSTSPHGVEFLAAGPVTDVPLTYSTAFEGMKYALWGFGVAAPADYTAIGQNLLENVLAYALAGGELILFVDFNDYSLGTLGAPWEVDVQSGSSTGEIIAPTADNGTGYQLALDGGDTENDYYLAHLGFAGTGGGVRIDVDIYPETDANFGFLMMKNGDRKFYLIGDESNMLSIWDYGTSSIFSCAAMAPNTWATVSMIAQVKFFGGSVSVLLDGQATSCTDMQISATNSINEVQVADYSDVGFGGTTLFDNIHIYSVPGE